MTTASEQADKTSESSRESTTDAARQASATLQQVVRDGLIATAGAGDRVVHQLKTLSERVRDLDLRTEQGRQEFEQRVSELRESAVGEFERFVARGRELIDDIGHSQAMERAAEQSRLAGSQVKAAATSVRNIATTTADQAAQAVSGFRKVADRGARQADVAASQTKAAVTGVRKAAQTGSDVIADAAERVGAEADQVALEDLKFIELRTMAKERDIPGRTGMNKAELIRALRES